MTYGVEEYRGIGTQKPKQPDNDNNSKRSQQRWHIFKARFNGALLRCRFMYVARSWRTLPFYDDGNLAEHACQTGMA
ncbi:hypothetical protein [Thalassospira marina]|uniref:hypothetical protein n=1 Tax=Thalassospira marina TaxID=2048283 RepID=UPI0012FF123E|nr:hypothetical protein [Thalassospira marina]